VTGCVFIFVTRRRQGCVVSFVFGFGFWISGSRLLILVLVLVLACLLNFEIEGVAAGDVTKMCNVIVGLRALSSPFLLLVVLPSLLSLSFACRQRSVPIIF